MATSFAIGFFHQGIKGKRFQMNLCKIASAATRRQINSTDCWQLACYTNLCSFTALSEQFTYQHHLNCIFRCCNSNPEHKINRFTET